MATDLHHLCASRESGLHSRAFEDREDGWVTREGGAHLGTRSDKEVSGKYEDEMRRVGLTCS